MPPPVQTPDTGTGPWTAAANRVPPSVRGAVAEVVDGACAALADEFYRVLLSDPDAAVLLDHAVVAVRLRQSMARWLVDLFAVEGGRPLSAVIAHQRHIGEVHARAQVPIHLVTRGARLLKRGICERLAASGLASHELPSAVEYTGEMVDLALELMSEAFVRNADRNARTEEAYRLFSATQNLGTERERQRAALSEWCQETLFQMGIGETMGRLPRLGTSEFGLWLSHKGLPTLGGAIELPQISESIARIDGVLLPRMEGLSPDDGHLRRELTTELQHETETIRFLLSTLFDRFLELEAGRDSLTRLLNRRFLPAVLSHEIGLHRARGQLLAVLLIDIDHFKHVNDTHGHDAGDVALQQLASVVGDLVRAGDFVFRYGGDEIVVVMVETSPAAASAVAEAVRARVEARDLEVGSGRVARVTTSIGIALFDGHPDPQQLVTRADRALAAAKRSGRNRWVLADSAGV